MIPICEGWNFAKLTLMACSQCFVVVVADVLFINFEYWYKTWSIYPWWPPLCCTLRRLSCLSQWNIHSLHYMGTGHGNRWLFHKFKLSKITAKQLNDSLPTMRCSNGMYPYPLGLVSLSHLTQLKCVHWLTWIVKRGHHTDKNEYLP